MAGKAHTNHARYKSSPNVPALSWLLPLLLLQHGVHSHCPPEANATMTSYVNNSYVRAIFCEYAEAPGLLLTHRNVHRLLQRLGLIEEPEHTPHLHSHHHDHHTHGHNPEETRGGSPFLPSSLSSSSSSMNATVGVAKTASDGRARVGNATSGTVMRGPGTSSSSSSPPSSRTASPHRAAEQREAGVGGPGSSSEDPASQADSGPPWKVCGTVHGALAYLSLPPNTTLTPDALLTVCPGLLHYLLIRPPRCAALPAGPGHPFKLEPLVGRSEVPGQPYRVVPHDYDISRAGYGSENPNYNPRKIPPPYDPRNPGYIPPGNSAFDQRYPGYDPRNNGYDPRSRGYNPRQPGYDPRSTGGGHNDHRDHDHNQAGGTKLDYTQLHPGYNPDRGFDSDDPRGRRYGPRDRNYDHQGRRRPYDGIYRGPVDHSGDYDYDNYHYDDRDRRWDGKESIYARWVGGVVSMLLIGCISLGCTMVLPALRRSRHYDQVNHFLLSLAVGTLAGDALIHLLPHAISMGGDSQYSHSDHNDHELYLHEHRGSEHFRQALYGFTALMGIIIFLFLERLHNIRSGGKSHGHSHGGASVPSSTVDRTSSLPRNASILLSDTSIDVIGLPPSRKIGKKLSEHSKDDSFNNAADSGDAARCFGGCPPQNRPGGGGGADDANTPVESSLGGGTTNCVSGGVARHGTDSTNTTLRRDQVLPVRRQPLKDGSGGPTADMAERERLMSPLSITEKLADQVNIADKSVHATSPRDDSGSVNIVLQEYHVSHHGHSHHGHAHVSGRKDSLRTMILIGEGMHIFMDGMAIGAAFATSLTGGIATAIAVLCHELPHKVADTLIVEIQRGVYNIRSTRLRLRDFALLFDMGMTRRTALQMVSLMWLLSVIGMIIGELVGSIEAASPWIYSFTAGIFLHLALVDLLSEVSVKGAESCSAAGQMLLQVSGMMVGAGIMLLIALYEHDLHNLLARVV